MKRILFVCFLISATCSGSFQAARAQSATAVSISTYTAKVNLLDSFISAGDMTNAQATWNVVHAMLMAELAYTKSTIASASTTATATTATAVNANQYSIYNSIWSLKANLAANRAALHTKLNDFGSTF